MSEDCHDSKNMFGHQDPRHLTDEDLADFEPFYDDVSDSELFKLACILLNTFEEGAVETHKLEYKL
jgi:hypothetical protein